MAHMSTDPDGTVHGPYPDKAGEFCGNHNLKSMDYPAPCVTGESPTMAERRRREYLAQMRFGKPSRTTIKTSEEMAADGWVGLYLKEDGKLYSWESPVETDELTEAVVTA